MSNKWKDHLLKSSIPLEYEVKKFLDSKGCVTDFEYSYIKDDENRIPTEFSYDIDASYIKSPHFIDLMIECKYRHRGTHWVFIPEEYGGPDEIYQNAFMHPNDHFCKYKFPFSGLFPIEFAPLCSKGIEITSKDFNPKSINQAIAQLSYAFPERIADGMLHQIEELSLSGFVFYHIPIIVTTANLFRLRSDVDIRTIEKATDLSEIADEHNSLVIKNKIGIQLRHHNQRVLKQTILSLDEELVKKKLNSFNDDVQFVLSVIATHQCPETLVIFKHSQDNDALSNLFDYIDNLLKPSDELIELIKKQQDEIKNKIDNYKNRKKIRHIT